MLGSNSLSSFWQDRPVFVTGATGLVGSWLIRRLITHGAEPVCLVRDWIPQSELVSTTLLEQVRVVRGDVRDQELLERTLGEYEVATVMHLAAQTIVGVANRNPVSTLDTNIRGTWALLEACRRSSTVQQIVLASSDKAYGAQEVLPYSETTPLEGRHPYDVSKSCTDLIAQMYAKTYELPVTITRCGNFYGGGDLNWNRLVPGTIRSLARGESPEIRSDGKSIRDYFFVEDGAAAYMLLAEKMASQPEFFGEAFNFSNEQQVSVLDLVTKIITIMGLNIKPNVRNEASNEILIQHLNASKAKNLLSWSPSFTLEAGLQETVKWYEHYLSNTTTGH